MYFFLDFEDKYEPMISMISLLVVPNDIFPAEKKLSNTFPMSVCFHTEF